MTEPTRKIVTPGLLLRRLEAFRIVRGSETSYLLRDKIKDRTYDFDAWQFFLLESLVAADSVERLQTVFLDRFDRSLTRAELDEFLGAVVDKGLFEDGAATHPILKPLMRKAYAVEDGKAVPVPAAQAAATPPRVLAPAAAEVPTGSAPAVPAAASGGSAAGAEKAAAAPQPAKPAAAKPGGGEPPPEQPEELPPGVQDALGLDWRVTRNFFGLFDPRPLLRLLYPLLYPVRHVVYAVPVLLAAMLLIVFGYSHLLLDDLKKLEIEFNLLEHLLFVFITIHVVTTITIATVAHHYKVQVDKLGIALTFGFLPRWAIKMTGADRMTRNQVMWLHGAPLLARVILLCLGAILWYTTRDANTALTQVALLLLLGCAAGLVLEAGNPLIKANGYYLLSAFLNERALRGKAYAAMLNKFKGGVYKAADNNLLALYGFLSATYVVFIVLLAGFLIGRFVFQDLSLTGPAMLLALGFAGVMLWRNYKGLKKFNDTFERQVQFDRWRSRTLPVEAVEGEVPAKKRASYWKTALLIVLVLALFLPYPYEPGGAFTVFPTRKASITTDIPGVIAEVRFDGGDSVKQGTVLARLASDDLQSDLRRLDAQIAEQQAVIANLRALPKPEEVKLAQQQLEVARSYLPFSGDKLARLSALLPSGSVTLEEVEAARREHQVNLAQVVEKEAALLLAKAGPTREQIAAAEAQLASLQEQRAGVDKRIARTVLTMPFDGNILSLHLKDKQNSYLTTGQSFAEVENTGEVTLQIDIVEGDLQYVKRGAKVRARAASFFEEDFEGVVTVIDRNVTPKSFGNVVRVLATFPNADGRLKTGMAGQAKLEPVEMPVWKAFSQTLVRFVRVQVWAWVP